MKRNQPFAIFFLAVAVSAANIPTPDPTQPVGRARILYEHEGDINHIACRPMMDCAIEAPAGERFIKRTIGDADHWPNSNDSLPSRFFSVKPGFAGLHTSLHLQTDHDNEYGFILDAIPGDGDVTTILKTEDAEQLKRIAAPATVVSREEYDRAKADADQARKELDQVRKEADTKTTQIQETAKATAMKDIAASMRSYSFDRAEAGKQPWRVSDIMTDGKFTYISRPDNAPDLPAIYALDQDGKPELTVPQYDPDRGQYVISRLIPQGYMTFASKKKNKRLPFSLPKS